MIIAKITIGAPQWVLPAVGVGAVMMLILIVAYLKTRTSSWIKITATVLKAMAILLLVMCLLNPLQSGTRPRPQANIFTILVDNSASMAIGEPGRTVEQRRNELVRRLSVESSWQARLEQDFNVRRYRFDSQLASVDSYDEASFEGTASLLGHALSTVHSRFAQRPVAGVLLFSDGNATDSEELNRFSAEANIPVFPVLPEIELRREDLRLGPVSVRETDFETAPVTLLAQLEHRGLAGEEVLVELLDAKSMVVKEQRRTLGEQDEPVSMRFRFRPLESGPQFYSIRACLADERELVAQGQSNREATVVNNSRLVTVDRGRGPYRLLYVAGRPNWEYKFLRRALSADDEIRMSALVRIAKEEPKFSFRDREVSSSNPFFSGFDEEETTEDYDEPVLIRLGVEDENELLGGFPTSEEGLFAYDAVILDDIQAGFFGPDQLLALRKYVSERGAGLLLMGGQGTFADGGYQGTALAELSPVYVDGRRRDSSNGEYRWELTREGMLETWMRLRDTEDSELIRLRDMPGFRTISFATRTKPGAAAMTVVRDEDGSEQPGLAVHRFGKGRVSALLVADMWRWAMQREPQQADDLAQAWRQLVRWLVADVPRRVEIETHVDENPTAPVRIEVQVRDELYRPLDNSQVEVGIKTPSGESFALSAVPSDENSGTYVLEFLPRERGGYLATAQVTTPDGQRLEEQAAGWASEPARKEYDRLSPDVDRLKELAHQSGGRIVQENELNSFVANYPSSRVPVTETWVYPFWHRAWVLALAICCLCAEWGLRRWKGLA